LKLCNQHNPVQGKKQLNNHDADVHVMHDAVRHPHDCVGVDCPAEMETVALAE
jgi:hypothetical protein